MTRPIDGRDLDTRLASTVARAGQAVAGQHRLLPFDVVDARRALRGRIEQEGVAEQPHEHRAGMPAGGRQPAENAGLAGRLVEMHRLRIELAGEFDDLLRRHVLGAEIDRAAFDEILEGPCLARSCEILFRLEPLSLTGELSVRLAAAVISDPQNQSQPLRRKNQKGSTAETTIRPSANG